MTAEEVEKIVGTEDSDLTPEVVSEKDIKKERSAPLRGTALKINFEKPTTFSEVFWKTAER